MRGEPDRYLAATLAPAETRAGLAAIAAFAAELARVPATVSEPMLGDIRLQWWREALQNGRAGTRSGHPVADAVCDAEQRFGLSPQLLEAMIDARELDLAGGMPQDDEGLRTYLAATQGNVFELSLTILGATAGDEAVHELARRAGEAYGVAWALGRLAQLIHNGGVILPAERLKANGGDPAALGVVPVMPETETAIKAVAAELEADARRALAVVRGQWRGLDRRLRPALLPLAMVEPYFRAQSRRRAPLDWADVSPLGRVGRIGLAYLAGRV
jgi:phytoene synthase